MSLHRDEWSGFADMLAGLIEKYAEVLDIEHFPNSPLSSDLSKNPKLPDDNPDVALIKQ